MSDISAAPQAIQELGRWLADGGTVLAVDSFESPTSQRLRAHTARGTLQVVADRGQWFVELAPLGSSEFFDTAVWAACLAGVEVSVDVIPIDAQVAWLERFLKEGDLRSCTIECLLEARRRRAYRRMGLLP